MDMIVLILVSLTGFGLIKVWSMKPVDADGRTILTWRDRAIGLGIALLGLMTIIFIISQSKIEPKEMRNY